MPGSNPTFASCFAQAGLAFKAMNALNLFGSSNTPNWADMEDAITTGLDGIYTPAALNLIKAARKSIASPLSRDQLRSLWRPFLQETCRSIGSQELTSGSDVQMLRAIRKYMVANAQTINSRGMTLNSPSADGGNAGSGTILRVTVDKDGNPLEGTGAEAKQAICTQDAQSGARKGAEVFRFTGSPAGEDNLSWEGSGFSADVPTAHPLTSRIIKNPSFDTNGASSDNTAPSSTTAITGWTIGSSASNFALRSASGYYYATYPGAPSTLWGLEFTASDSISQIIADVNPGVSFDPATPYFCGLRWKRKSSATGTLTLNLGASNASATIGSATNDVWNHLYIALGTGNYLQNFNEESLDLLIDVSTLATGTVVVDHLVCAPMVNVDGTYYLPIGADTPFLRDDLFTWTDTDGGTRAILSYLLWLAYGADGWLPSDNGGTETVSDPS